MVAQRRQMKDYREMVEELREKRVLRHTDTLRTTGDFEERVNVNRRNLSKVWKGDGLFQLATLYSLIELLGGVEEGKILDYYQILASIPEERRRRMRSSLQTFPDPN